MQDFHRKYAREAKFHRYLRKIGDDMWRSDKGPGRARNQTKQFIQQELVANDYSAEEELAWAFSEETEENIYCHLYGPCDRCKISG